MVFLFNARRIYGGTIRKSDCRSEVLLDRKHYLDSGPAQWKKPLGVAEQCNRTLTKTRNQWAETISRKPPIRANSQSFQSFCCSSLNSYTFLFGKLPIFLIARICYHFSTLSFSDFFHFFDCHSYVFLRSASRLLHCL